MQHCLNDHHVPNFSKDVNRSPAGLRAGQTVPSNLDPRRSSVWACYRGWQLLWISYHFVIVCSVLFVPPTTEEDRDRGGTFWTDRLAKLFFLPKGSIRSVRRTVRLFATCITVLYQADEETMMETNWFKSWRGSV